MMIEEKHHTQTYTSGTRNLPKQLSVYIYPESEKSQGYQRPGTRTHHELDLLDLQMALLWSEKTSLNKLSSSVIIDKLSPASLFEDNQETGVRTDPAEEQLDFPAEASTFNAKIFSKDILQETWREDAIHQHFIDSLLEIQKRQEQERIHATEEQVLAGS
ncbi:MAG TPA: hypothetical protein VFN23_03965 [Ktedonobacteraceae bacterium]|nr:hypothetical protein [Ktedonobacteraceae bacterium]